MQLLKCSSNAFSACIEMFANKKVVVVMPAYNAAETLRRTYDEVMAQEIVDLVIVVDDAGSDETTQVAKTLPSTIVHAHQRNQGYGANQKTCYIIVFAKLIEIFRK